ncbi:transcription repressor NadR [Senegalia massiliensis]|uniref:Transcription repressor NadR n=1 Tax=Senegalia massiliensis TaxID=1720316 RepID=A0A845QU18_9CLOT|nr:transcription repressor NadR [Senegalia massiliensis]NBI06347.1 transcription repressor NadR [Senegalia massiliensis]
MDSNNRRKKILELLIKENNPIKGAIIADKFNVSRQVIVQDIAILRAKGKKIMATPNGYMVIKDNNNFLEKTIVSVHRDDENIEEELNIIVDLGAKVLDVIVEHPVYGEIKGQLMISSRKDVKDFIKNMKENNASTLATLTEGVHIHTIRVPNEEVFSQIKEKLKYKNFLLE